MLNCQTLNMFLNRYYLIKINRIDEKNIKEYCKKLILNFVFARELFII